MTHSIDDLKEADYRFRDADMERVEIWYLTDSDAGKDIAVSLKKLGLSCNLVTGPDFKKCDISMFCCNLFVLDLIKKELPAVMKIIRNDERIGNFPKFVIIKKKDIKEAVNASINLLHVEFLSRPLIKREFILLLEKSIVVERYREIMRHISRDAEERIGAFESLMNIGRKDMFESKKEKEAFEKIIDHERHIIEEQGMLNRAIKEFTILRQKELFDMRNRINAEEMLSGLRNKELVDANDVIKAQESLIDFSSKELHDAKKVINATEQVQELGRMEAMHLHEELKKMRESNRQQSEEINKLKAEMKSLRKTK
jgi:hypothetical protein